MNRRDLEKWCQQNNWSELRQLESGLWVAFPPGGLIEMPLPAAAKKAAQTSGFQGEKFLYGLILIIAGAVVTAIALIISPLFLPVIIQKHKRSRSLPSAETYNN